MHFFYEVIIRLPNDLETQVPGIEAETMDTLLHSSITLPPSSKWELALIDYGMVSMGAIITRIVTCFWQMLNPLLDTPYFIQLEEGVHFYHLHCLLSWRACDSLVLGRYTKKMKEKIIESAFGGIEPNVPEWFAVTKTRAGGKNRLVNEEYIERYLLPKVQREVHWAWSDLPQYEHLLLNADERAQYNACLSREANLALVPVGEEEPGPSVQTAAAKNYSRLVDWLVEQGITSEKEWLTRDKAGYRSFHANSNSTRQIKAALENARSEIILTKTASDYLVGPEPLRPICSNKIVKLFCMNDYDPQTAGKILFVWGKGGWGKRNTIWLTGPASTGKTNLAEAIAHSVPLYGCVNWTNENFPFNDCTDKMLIWWEEGKMTAKIVEAAKSILGGSKVRVDQKCKNSVQINPTPVIITSNVDMTLVIDGNIVTREHQEPLQHRMWKFEFNQTLPPDWGKITVQDVKDFFYWAQSLTLAVPIQFEVPKVPGGGVLHNPPIDLTDDSLGLDLPLSPSLGRSSASNISVHSSEGGPTSDQEGSSTSSSIVRPARSAIKLKSEEEDSSEGEDGPCCKRSRYEAVREPLVCLEHDRANCEACGPSQCLFTAGTYQELECDEHLSQMSSLSSPLSPPIASDIEDLSNDVPPTPSPPPLLHDLFDVSPEPHRPPRVRQVADGHAVEEHEWGEVHAIEGAALEALRAEARRVMEAERNAGA